MPFLPPLLPPSSTETDPGGNFFNLGGPPGGLCFAGSGDIGAVTMIDLGMISETQLFISPNHCGDGVVQVVPGTLWEECDAGAPSPCPGTCLPPGDPFECRCPIPAPAPPPPLPLPGIDIISGGSVFSFGIAGSSKLMCGGVLCLPGLAEAVAVTDNRMATVVGGNLITNSLPFGSGPVSAGLITTCLGGGNTMTLCVETTAPSVECVLNGVPRSFPIPAPIVAVPDSYTTGPVSGVVVFTLTTAYVLSGGTTTPIPLGGDYVGHVPAPTGEMVTTTTGAFLIPLGAGVSIVPFASCGVPLDSCPAASGSAISVNTGPCTAVAASSATWPATGAQCLPPGGPGFGPGPAACPPAPKIKDKWAQIYAFAHTQLGAPDSDGPRAVKIWNAGAPGIAGPLALALAVSAGGGDLSFAVAAVSAAYDPATCKLDVTPIVFGGNFLGHTKGHFGRYVARVRDPVVFEEWDDTLDLDVGLVLAEGPLLPIGLSLDTSAVSTFTLDSGTDIAGFSNLYTMVLTATQDGISTLLDVDFVSNPSLGLSDAAIEATIAGIVIYDPVLESFVVSATTDVAPHTVPVPTGTTDIVVTQNALFVSEQPEFGGTVPNGFCGDTIANPLLNEECDPPDGVTCDPECQLTGTGVPTLPGYGVFVIGALLLIMVAGWTLQHRQPGEPVSRH